MENQILIYLLKVNLYLVIGYLFYRWILSRQTRFQLNRWILLAQIALVFWLPVIQLPQAWHPLASESFLSEQITIGTAIESAEVPLTGEPDITESLGASPIAEVPGISLSDVLIAIYGLGLLVFTVRLCVQFLSLYKLRKSAHLIDKQQDYTLIWCQEGLAPFSFFQWIFLPSKSHESEDISRIIQHEAIHVRQYHSLDMLLSEMLIILLWFNPFVWLYKKAIESNLEYLTDQWLIRTGTPKKDYMYHLLSITFPEWKANMGISYNQSFIHKRIKMMNTKISTPRSLWAYGAWLLILPFLMFCNEPLAPTTAEVYEPMAGQQTYIIITSDATAQELEILQQTVDAMGDSISLLFPKLELDSDGKILEIMAHLNNYGSGGSISKIRGQKQGFSPISFKIAKKGSMHVGPLSVKELDKLVNAEEKINILTAGIKADKQTLKAFRPKLQVQIEQDTQERMQELEQNNWQSETSGSTTYRAIEAEKLEVIKQRIIWNNAPTVRYFLNDEVAIDEFPAVSPDNIASVELKTVTVLQYKPNTTEVENRFVKELQVLIRTK